MPNVAKVQLLRGEGKVSRREMARRMNWLSSINERLGHVSQMVLADIHEIEAIAKQALADAQAAYGERGAGRLWLPGRKAKDKAETLAAVGAVLSQGLKAIEAIALKYPVETLTQGIVRMIQARGVATVSAMDLLTHFKKENLPEAEVEFKKWLEEHEMGVTAMAPDSAGVLRYDVRLKEKGGILLPLNPSLVDQTGENVFKKEVCPKPLHVDK